MKHLQLTSVGSVLGGEVGMFVGSVVGDYVHGCEMDFNVRVSYCFHEKLFLQLLSPWLDVQ